MSPPPPSFFLFLFSRNSIRASKEALYFDATMEMISRIDFPYTDLIKSGMDRL